VSDVSQYRAFKLRDDLADPEVGFDYGVVIAKPDGSEFLVGEALLSGDGIIVTDDQGEKDSLRAWGAVEETDVPSNFTPPAAPVDEGPSLTELKAKASELDIDGRSSMNKAELAEAITAKEAELAEAEAQAQATAPVDPNATPEV
jgi:hypothetical protein